MLRGAAVRPALFSMRKLMIAFGLKTGLIYSEIRLISSFLGGIMSHNPTNTADKIEKVKILLASETKLIELHDFIVEEIKNFLAATCDDKFSSQGQLTNEELRDRITKYEEEINDLALVTACISYWARPSHKSILQKIIARSTDCLNLQGGGSQLLIYLRWYPLIVGLYCAGITSIDGKRFDSLANILYSTTYSLMQQGTHAFFAEAIANGISMLLLNTYIFKLLPGCENDFTPMSKHLSKILQPKLEDIFFIGKNYEKSFDEFEVFFALVVSDLNKQRGGSDLGPIGRFGWKHRRGRGPLDCIVEEASNLGDNWEPIRAGLFGGSYDRFKSIADDFRKLLNK